MDAARYFLIQIRKSSHVWTALAVMVALLGAGSALQRASAQTAQSDMPAGPGQAIFENTCTQCHGSEMVTGMRMTKDGWQATIDDMIAKGAKASDDDIKVLADYLAKNFGDSPKINVNKATAKELQTGLELTDKDAQALVDYRTKNGDYKTVDDLHKVAGVDVGKIDAKKDQITF